jgi:hypothetical protein
MNNETRSPWLRRSRLLVLAAALGITAASVVRPAFGQANMSCVTEQLNDNEFTCDDCTSYQTCFNSETESLYYSVQGQRFDCEGYDCTQATERLQELCCDTEPTPASSGKSSEGDDGGCAFVGLGSRATRSAPWALAVLAALSIRRKKRTPLG